MKDKKKLLFIIFIIIFLFLFIVLIVYNNGKVKNICVKNIIDNYDIFSNEEKLTKVTWYRHKDDYNATKYVKFVGDPIPNDLVLFEEGKVKFCTEVNIKRFKYKCGSYDYSIKDDILTVIKVQEEKEEEVIYSYKFLENELVLTINGDGFVYNVYYEKASKYFCDLRIN